MTGRILTLAVLAAATFSLALPSTGMAVFSVPTGSPGAISGLEIYGDPASETIAVTCVGGNVKVNGADPANSNGSFQIACSAFRNLNALGYGGDDVFDFTGVTAAAGFTNPGIRSDSALFATGHGGRDLAFTGQFSLAFSGGPGRDVARGGPTSDFLDGGNGDDRLAGFGADDTFSAGAGDDRIFGGAGHEVRIFGASGRDIIHGGPGPDGVVGGDGNDRLYGDAGNDAAFGSQGNDLCRAEYVDLCER